MSSKVTCRRMECENETTHPNSYFCSDDKGNWRWCSWCMEALPIQSFGSGKPQTYCLPCGRNYRGKEDKFCGNCNTKFHTPGKLCITCEASGWVWCSATGHPTTVDRLLPSSIRHLGGKECKGCRREARETRYEENRVIIFSIYPRICACGETDLEMLTLHKVGTNVPRNKKLVSSGDNEYLFPGLIKEFLKTGSLNANYKTMCNTCSFNTRKRGTVLRRRTSS